MSQPDSVDRERNSTASCALDILLMFDERRSLLTVADVEERLKVARSTAYRYLQSLTRSQLIEDAGDGEYRLGRRVLMLGRLARRGMGLSELARPVMRRLASDIGETVLLTRLVSAGVLCLERENADGRVARISYERGEILTADAGASGFALLAWLPASEAKAILDDARFESFTEHTPTMKQDALARLRDTRKCGYAISRGECNRDVFGVASPLRHKAGDVVAAVSVVALSARVPSERLQPLAESVQAAAEEITTMLAHRA